MKTPEDLVMTSIGEGVRDPRVLTAIREVPRAGFVPPELTARAYVDEPLPIPHGQVTSQPSLVARMVEALELKGSEVVLEVGTGYGWQTALLGRLAAKVYSIERWPDLAEAARENLAAQGITNVEILVGDGSAGLPEHAPFDAIIVSAAFPEVPGPLAEQVALGGYVVQPIGPGGREDVVLFEKTKDGLLPRRVLTGARFVRLYGKYGFRDEGR